MAKGCWERFPTAFPTPRVSIHLSQTEQPESLTRWQRRWSVVESHPRVAIYLTNTAHTPKATILQQPWFAPAQLSKQRWWDHADRPLFLLKGENQERRFHPLWMLGLDLLLYPAVVYGSEVTSKTGTLWYMKHLYSYFSLYLRSVLSRTPNCLLGCFHRSCHGATNPVFYAFTPCFDVIIEIQIW